MLIFRLVMCAVRVLLYTFTMTKANRHQAPAVKRNDILDWWLGCQNTDPFTGYEKANCVKIAALIIASY